ncbi:M48 family metallopeptidase [Candidatus Bathyarchaeota archaeon]|jgi:hypothetical protein|nr:M48 family metallopeptidase [Candidatus Bathyarchaeota archaeon]
MTLQTRKYATERVERYRRKLGFSYRGVELTDARRWGHCTRDRKLVFNWQLAALPKHLADYVVLHEISHLSEFSHNNRHRMKIFSLCPDFNDREQELRNIVPMRS